jgi:hypothetical protein
MNKNVKPLIGQTIVSIDTSTINCWKVKFASGDYVELWTETDGPYGLPCLYVDALNDPTKNNSGRVN